MSARILIGDVRAKLAELPAESVDCVVTSPPYWGLRDYGVHGQIGLEPTLGEHLDVMVAVFDAVRRVMKPHATLWINYGDCYATKPAGWSADQYKSDSSDDRTFRDKPFSTVGAIYAPHHGNGRGEFEGAKIGASGAGPRRVEHGGRDTATRGGVLKPKDLCLIPERLAIALQEAGWWVRAKNVWGKPNPMPDSSGKYRPSTAHEMVWMLGKSDVITCWRHDDGRWTWEEPAPDYLWKNRKTGKISKTPRAGADWYRVNLWTARDQFYEPDAVALPVSGGTHARVAQDVSSQAASLRAHGGGKANGPMKAVVRVRRAEMVDAAHPPGSRPHTGLTAADKRRRGKGQRLDGALTEDPAERMTRYLRNYEPAPAHVWEIPTFGFSEAHFATFPPELSERCILAGCPAGGVVLDPFAGSGTVGLVADALGRGSILIELSDDYAAIAARRLKAGLVRVDGGDSRRGLAPLPLEVFADA